MPGNRIARLGLRRGGPIVSFRLTDDQLGAGQAAAAAAGITVNELARRWFLMMSTLAPPARGADGQPGATAARQIRIEYDE